jgi:hypothetical protein
MASALTGHSVRHSDSVTCGRRSPRCRAWHTQRGAEATHIELGQLEGVGVGRRGVHLVQQRVAGHVQQLLQGRK